MDFESVRRGKIQKWCYLWCDLAAAKLEDERDACYYTNVAGKDEPATAILDSKLQAIKPTGVGCYIRSGDYAFLRLDQPRPASPRPNRARVAGAGTDTLPG